MRARMCERRLTRPSSMTMRSASARASGFLPWSFPRRARAAALPRSRLARPRCSGQPSQPAAPAAVTRRGAVAPGRRVGQPDVRRIAELLTRGSASVGRRCAQRGPGPPGERAERLVPGPGASSAGGTRHGPAGAARDPRRVGRASPELARHERGIGRSSQGPCASSVTPNPGTPMPAYGRWYARTGIIWLGATCLAVGLVPFVETFGMFVAARFWALIGWKASGGARLGESSAGRCSVREQAE